MIQRPSDFEARDQAFAFGADRPCDWIVSDAERDHVRSMLADAEGHTGSTQLRGPRWGAHDETAQHAAVNVRSTQSPGVDTPAPSTIVLGTRPAELPGLAALADAEGPSRIVTLDWPLPGRIVRATYTTDGGHQLWVYDAGGTAVAASFEERHQLAVFHPAYDGFIVTYVVAHVDINDLRLVVDAPLCECVAAHHAQGPLLRGQVRPVDLELLPQAVLAPAVTGRIRVADGDRLLRGPHHRLTLAVSTRTSCSVAGDKDGPLPADELDRVADLLLAGKLSPAAIAAAIERAERRARAPRPTGISGLAQRSGDRLRRRLRGIA